MNKVSITPTKIDLDKSVKNKLSKTISDSKKTQQNHNKKREYGFAKGKIKLCPDFDAPIVFVSNN
jgi:hypothetical protein